MEQDDVTEVFEPLEDLVRQESNCSPAEAYYALIACDYDVVDALMRVTPLL